MEINMRVNLLFILLICVVLFSMEANGVNILQRFFGIGVNKSTTAAPARAVTSAKTTTTTTPKPPPVGVVGSKTDGSCWWTPCGSYCRGGASVTGANRCENGAVKLHCCVTY